MPLPINKKNGKHKKKSSRNSEDEDLPAIDVQYNPDIIDGHLQDIEELVDSKCNQIQKDIDFMKTSLQQAFHLELIKIPTQVKQMSVSRFREEFGESLEAVTRDAISGGLKNQNNILMTAPKGAKANGKVFQTPANNTKGIDGTIRQPREGEKILSTNGSPLGVFNTVVKAPKAGPGLIPQTPGVFVPLNTGDIVELDDVSTLSEDLKQDALIKVQMMMSNMQNLMNKLSQPT